MTDVAPREQAAALRDLHEGPDVLLLPCAWDAASARLFEEIGFPAIGTSSGAIANSLGYPDGQRVSVEQMLAAIERIARAVSVPVSADFEAGYATSVEGATANVRKLLDAGVVGLNVEDGTGANADPFVDVDEQVELIRSLRSLADSTDLPFVINARTDAFLRGEGDPDDRFELAVERAKAYREAGADCLFPIGADDPPVVEDLVEAIDGPVNVLAFGPDAPAPSLLERLGVARVSSGAGFMHASLGSVRRAAEGVYETGEYPEPAAEPVSRWDFHEWFESLDA